jgi:alkylated DNA repair dioxygenase AlkB
MGVFQPRVTVVKVLPISSLDLFSKPSPAETDCSVEYHPALFDPEERKELMRTLLKEIDWQQDHIVFYGKRIPLPRLTAWYGDPGFSYTYSGIAMNPQPWTPALKLIKARVDNLCETVFNSVLLNQYRDGNDKVSWHSDDESELGPNPTIASVSLGATRRFKFRQKPHELGNDSLKVDLHDGSCLVMAGRTQALWEHELAKTSQSVGPRINLTFRKIIL